MNNRSSNGEATPFQNLHEDDPPQGEERKPVSIEQLVQQIKETADKLIRDKAIGDILLVRLELTKPPMTKEEMADPKIGWRVVPAIGFVAAVLLAGC